MSGPGWDVQSISPGSSSTFRASNQWMCCAACFGTPNNEVPVSAMAVQSPCWHISKGSPPMVTFRMRSSQYPSSGLCTSIHWSSPATRRLSYPPKVISLGTRSSMDTNTPKLESMNPFSLLIWPMKLNSGSRAKLSKPKPSTPSNSKSENGSAVISVAKTTRSRVQSAPGIVTEEPFSGTSLTDAVPDAGYNERQVVSRANSPTTSPVPKATETWSRSSASAGTRLPS
mmetsp:Transcript_60107/g.173346  ORF Transcript_60107/g.173346 Transcript_60107/m.173346 type:complete len:228 (+) Transcript_60107:455-1138(+)